MSTSDAPYASCSYESPQPGCALIHITGELDAASTGAVQSEVFRYLAPGHQKIVINLTDVLFMDSMGIQLLVQVMHRKKADEEVVVVCPKARTARRALEIVGLARVVRLVPTLEEALATA